MTQPMRRDLTQPRSWTEASEPFASAALAKSRETFAREFAGDYLCFFGCGAADQEESFGTLAGGDAGLDPRFLTITSVVKRPGANPFSLMVTIGRAANNDIQISFSEISKFHAYLTRGEGHWTLTDAGSTNGTFLGGSRLKPRSPTQVEYGVEIGLAALQAQILDAVGLYDLLQPLPA